MSIKSDNWIRRMARDQKMIEPFAEEQVRQVNGQKIVSYGTSSYGYDVRCASEFKIFTNINSTIVDPKNFDEKSFVDFGGDVCIIPPNSFALARTVEYFRIPRSVLTVCLGKCVTADTRVVDASSGALVPITEMRFGSTTLGMDGWSLKPAAVSAFVPQGKKPVFELRTRAGLRIRTTANHPFRMPQGWVPLQDLVPGDRIAVARSIPVFGRTAIPDWEASLLGLMTSEGQCHTPGHGPTFTSADPVLVQLLRDSMAASGMGTVTCNGSFGYRLVNREGCGGVAERNRTHEWLGGYGLNVAAADKSVPRAIFTAPEQSVRLFLQALFAADGGLCHSSAGVQLEYYAKSRRLIEDVHHLLLRFGIFSLIREKATAIGARACSIQVTDSDQIARFAARIGFVPGCVKQLRLDEKITPLIGARAGRRRTVGSLPQEAWALMSTAAQRAQVRFNSSGIRASRDQSVSYAAAGRLATATHDETLTPVVEDGPLWDCIESIEAAGEEEVYDISVPRVRNFVANDFVVHNSTYARCFRGDTRVALVDGTTPTLEEMARRKDSGEIFWGYSIGENGRVIVSLIDAPRFIGRDSLIEIELDSGALIHATPDHQFIRRDGHMVEAQALRPDDALMPLYRDVVRGYEVVYQPMNGRMYATRCLADEWNFRHGIHEAVPAFRRHHMDFGRRDNRPLNIEGLPAAEHIGTSAVRTARDATGSIRAAARLLEGDRLVFRRFPGVVAGCAGRPIYRNHRVAGVRALPGDHDVYCLTVPEAGNFALEAGVFVQNCGIIVNVTPLEPEWEGHVTLEFSNTTTLPAKIYANEGVAQMLFFESDEVCSTSYRDRGGKYQGQRGVTLPKT